MKTPNYSIWRFKSIIIILLCFTSFLSAQAENDFENCTENFDEIVCIPWIRDALLSYGPPEPIPTITYKSFDYKLSIAYNNSEWYYVFTTDQTYCQDVLGQTFSMQTIGSAFVNCNFESVFSCVDSFRDGIFASSFCFDSNMNQIDIGILNGFTYLEIWNSSQSLPNCTSSSLDPCFPCISTPCFDSSQIDGSIQCPEIYNPVCGCDGVTYFNECVAKFRSGITSVIQGPCNSNACIDEDVIDDTAFCTLEYTPICGCDGQTYTNACVAEKLFGVTNFTVGPCNSLECIDSTLIVDIVCPQNFNPVCGCNGVTYPNECYAFASGVKSWVEGECQSECINEDIIIANPICPLDYNPVCGCNNLTYSNECAAISAGVTDYISGECANLVCDSIIYVPLPIVAIPSSGEARDSCLQYGQNVVCGCDGIEYANSCFAFLNGVEYFTSGPCGSTVCITEPVDIECPLFIDPVCGCDGEEYNNSCTAIKNGINDWTYGPCSSCVLPANIIYQSNAFVSSALLQVINGPSDAVYRWEYKLASNTSWTFAGTTSSNSTFISSLAECSDYNWRVEIICQNNISTGVSAIQSFMTECVQDCVIPANIRYESDATISSALLEVVNGPSNATYRWEYKLFNSSSWIFAGVTTNNSINISQLQACSNYNWRVEIICENNVSAGLSGIQSFMTECVQDCVLPANIRYESDPDTNTALLEVANGPSNATYIWQYRLLSSSSWIFGGSTTNNSINISQLQACSNYNWRVEIVCQNNVSAGLSGIQTFMTECVQDCVLPANIRYESDSGATTTLLEVVNGLSNATYRWQYKLLSSPSWIFAGITSNSSINISQLQSCTDYNWRVEIICDNNESAGSSGIQSFMTECVQDCNLPGNIRYESDPGSNSTLLEVVNGPSNTTYRWEYKLLNSSSWTFAGSTTNSSVNISQLQSCTNYDWRVEIICENNASAGFSGVQSFITECIQCEIPEENMLITNTISDNSILLAFLDNNENVTYDWLYKKDSEDIWEEIISTVDNQLILGDLESCQKYNWRLRVECENNEKSSFSDVQFFETICNECILEEDISYETVFEPNGSVTFVINEMNPGDTYNWQFKEVGSTSWSSSITTNSPSFSISSLDACKDYEWRVNLNCINGISSSFSGSILFSTTCDNCLLPIDINYSVSSITKTNVIFEIENGIENGSYIWQYKAEDDNVWTSFGATFGQQLELQNLTPCTNYFWRVEAYCDDNTFAGKSDDFEFVTICNDCVFDNSTVFSELSKGVDFIEIKVSDLNVSDPYIIWKYRKAGDQIWNSAITGANSNITISNLKPCQEYEYQLELYCEDNSNDISEIKTFTTDCLNDTKELTNFNLNVFPNPFTESITISRDLGVTKIKYDIFDQYGRLIAKGYLESTFDTEIQTHNLETGVYFLRLETSQYSSTKKIIKL